MTAIPEAVRHWLGKEVEQRGENQVGSGPQLSPIQPVTDWGYKLIWNGLNYYSGTG